MMPKRISVSDITPIRVVIVTLDGHLANAVTRASGLLRSELPGLQIGFHAASYLGDDAEALARCTADLAGPTSSSPP